MPPPPALKAATAAKHAAKHAAKTAKKGAKQTPVPRVLHREIKYEIPRLFDPRYVKDTSESVGLEAKEQVQAGVGKVGVGVHEALAPRASTARGGGVQARGSGSVVVPVPVPVPGGPVGAVEGGGEGVAGFFAGLLDG
jgi:hypothetical protein